MATTASGGASMWAAIRSDWCAQGEWEQQIHAPASRAKEIDTEGVMEALFDPESDGRLEEPVPLAQLVDVLVDVWEAEGLFDRWRPLP